MPGARSLSLGLRDWIETCPSVPRPFFPVWRNAVELGSCFAMLGEFWVGLGFSRQLADDLTGDLQCRFLFLYVVSDECSSTLEFLCNVWAVR